MSRQQTVTGKGKPAKGVRGLTKLAMLAIVIVLAWFAVSVWDQNSGFREGHIKLEALEIQRAEIFNQNEILKREIDRLSDPEYQQELVRKDLNVSKDDETVFTIPSAEKR